MSSTVQATIEAACRKLELTVKDLGIELRYDARSIGELEQVLLELKDLGDGAALSGASFMVGAFIGEMIRREVGGHWSPGADGTLAIQLNSGDQIFPVEKVRKFVANPKDEGLDFYFQAVVARAS